MAVRGTNQTEIAAVLRTGLPDSASPPKLAKAAVFPFGQFRGSRRYEQKKVRVIYVVEGEDELVVTVYVYYGSWNS